MDNHPTDLPSTLPPMFRKSIWKKWIWLGVGIVVLLALVGGGTGYYAAKNKSATTTDASQDKITVATPVVVDTETWLDEPQKINSPKIFLNLVAFYQGCGSSGPGCMVDETVTDINDLYYKVGTYNNKDIILVDLPPVDPSGDFTALLIADSKGKYSLLRQHSSSLFDSESKSYSGPTLATNITIDDRTALKSIIYKEQIIFKGAKLTSSGPWYDTFSNLVYRVGQSDGRYKLSSDFTKLEEGKLYIKTIGSGDGFGIQVYVLRLPDQTTLEYQAKPSFMGDDMIPVVTWNDGKTNIDTYRTDGIGSCGSANGLAVLDTTSLDGLKSSGKSKNGDTIYEFNDANNPTLQYFYKQYSVDFEGKPVAGTLTLEQYRAKHAIFVYQDKIGRLVVFNNTVYGSQAECGKPVVYLYPTVPTSVSVQVDAKITKSDPAYGNGWNVLAMPTGKLFSGSKSYDSLFWEGTGKLYPTISSGFVVAQADLTKTLTNQLHQLGLNNKESADFLEFWLPKMPITPYVRLTWFGKNQMDQLAPLSISPKPDTVIRIFMDFEGLNQPIAISPQRLSAPMRRGFTVVEWGGLLRGLHVAQ